MVSRRQNCILIRVLCAVTSLTYAARVSEVSCPKGSECDTITHSTCTSGKCQCSTGFVEDLNDGSTCVQVVTEVTCTGADPCPGIDNSECSSDKCACKTGFTQSANTCVKAVNSIQCTTPGTECETVQNAECDATAKHCKCSDGYVMNVGVCASKNVAATLRIGAATLLFLVILAVCN